jgi:hypothetical protein
MSRTNSLLVLGASSALVVALPTACGNHTTTGSASPTTYDASFADAGHVPDGAGGGGGDAASGGEAGAEQQGDASPTGAAADGGASATAYVRLADWAADAPAAGFDACVAPHGASGGPWTGPLLNGGAVPFPNVGRYVAVAPGTYDLKVVAPGSGCGSPAVVAIALSALAAGAHTTVAVIGDLMPTGNDQTARAVAYTDDATPPQGQAAVRFVDAMPGASAVVIGTGKSNDFSFFALTPSVPFGALATMTADGGTSDSNDYLRLAPLAGGMLSAHVPPGEVDTSTGGGTSFDGGFVNSGTPSNILSGIDVATGSNAAWPAGSLVTVALVKRPPSAAADGGGASSGGLLVGSTPAQFVVCRDDAPAQGVLSACSALAP